MKKYLLLLTFLLTAFPSPGNIQNDLVGKFLTVDREEEDSHQFYSFFTPEGQVYRFLQADQGPIVLSGKYDFVGDGQIKLTLLSVILDSGCVSQEFPATCNFCDVSVSFEKKNGELFLSEMINGGGAQASLFEKMKVVPKATVMKSYEVFKCVLPEVQ